MILHKSRILWWSRRVRWGSCLFWTLWIGIQSNETQTAGKNFTHLPMLDQDYLDGFHRLANSSAQTEAPSFAKNDSQNVAEKDPSNLGRGSTHLGQHAQKRWIPWSRGLAFVVFFDQKSRLLRRVSMLWGCLSCFKDGEAFLVWHVALRLTPGPRTSSTSQVRLETSHRRIHKQPGRRRPCDQCCCMFSPDNPFLKETCFSGYCGKMCCLKLLLSCLRPWRKGSTSSIGEVSIWIFQWSWDSNQIP